MQYSTILLLLLSAASLVTAQFVNGHVDLGKIPGAPDYDYDEKVGTEITVDLHLNVHHPCLGRPNQYEKIRFARIQLAPLRRNPSEPDCYYLAGPVNVWSEISEEDMEIYVEMRASLDPTEPPVGCLKADSVNEQYYGSCVYKQPCAYEDTHSEELQMSKVRITRANGVPLQCGEKLAPGLYNDLEMHFCPPTRQQFMQMASSSQGQQNSSWTQNTNVLLERYQLDNKLPFYIRVIVFNFGITDMFRDQQSVEKFQRRVLSLNETQQLPSTVRSRLPFNRFMAHTDNFVGCHILIGDVVLQPVQIDGGSS